MKPLLQKLLQSDADDEPMPDDEFIDRPAPPPLPATLDPEPLVVNTIRRDSPKVGRNEPCPCGSGKKFKKCCGP